MELGLGEWVPLHVRLRARTPAKPLCQHLYRDPAATAGVARRYEPHLNPANWMLEVTSPAAEKEMGVDFAEVWAASEPARWANTHSRVLRTACLPCRCQRRLSTHRFAQTL